MMATETAPDGWTIEWFPSTIRIINAEGVPQLTISEQPASITREMQAFRKAHSGVEQPTLFEEAR